MKLLLKNAAINDRTAELHPSTSHPLLLRRSRCFAVAFHFKTLLEMQARSSSQQATSPAHPRADAAKSP
jgi:hypothetical protein